LLLKKNVSAHLQVLARPQVRVHGHLSKVVQFLAPGPLSSNISCFSKWEVAACPAERLLPLGQSQTPLH